MEDSIATFQATIHSRRQADRTERQYRHHGEQNDEETTVRRGRPRRRTPTTLRVALQRQFDPNTITGENIIDDLDDPNRHRHILPAMTVKCDHCNGMLWPWESKTQNGYVTGSCCSSGKVVIAQPDLLPEPLPSLLTGTDRRSQDFRKNIRKYNRAFCIRVTGRQY